MAGLTWWSGPPEYPDWKSIARTTGVQAKRAVASPPPPPGKAAAAAHAQSIARSSARTIAAAGSAVPADDEIVSGGALVDPRAPPYQAWAMNIDDRMDELHAKQREFEETKRDPGLLVAIQAATQALTKARWTLSLALHADEQYISPAQQITGAHKKGMHSAKHALEYSESVTVDGVSAARTARARRAARSAGLGRSGPPRYTMMMHGIRSRILQLRAELSKEIEVTTKEHAEVAREVLIPRYGPLTARNLSGLVAMAKRGVYRRGRSQYPRVTDALKWPNVKVAFGYHQRTLLGPLHAAHVALHDAMVAEDALQVASTATSLTRLSDLGVPGKTVRDASNGLVGAKSAPKVAFDAGQALAVSSSGDIVTHAFAAGNCIVRKVPHGCQLPEMRTFRALKTELADIPGVLCVASLHHPYYFDATDGYHYFAYKWAGSEPLARYNADTWSLATRLRIAITIVRAFGLLHARGMAHGDFALGVDNVLVSDSHWQDESDEHSVTIVSWSKMHHVGRSKRVPCEGDLPGLAVVLTHLGVPVDALDLAAGRLTSIAMQLEHRLRRDR